MTDIQEHVVNSRLNQGYSLLGIFNSISTQWKTIGVVKGKHRMQINAFGYDEYIGNPAAYKEINE